MSRNDPRFSRRAVVQTGLLAGAAATLPRSLLAAADANSLPLITRVIPSTGEKMPVIGIGTNQFTTDKHDELRAILKRMSELGGSVIDTAAMYGGGSSETVIGQIMAEEKLRSKMFVATKFNAAGVGMGPPRGGAGGPPGGPGGPPPGAPAGGPPPGGPGGPPGAGGPPRGGGMMMDNVSGLESFERSLKRLQVDKVDLLMAHALASVEPLMPVMLDQKKQGRVRYIGITAVNPAQHGEMMEYMRKYPIDFIQVDYSMSSRSAANDVLPLAQERKIAVMAAVPLGGGRTSLMQQVAGRELPKWAADFDATSWSQFFLKYVVSHPAITVAIPGSSKLTHVADNQGAGHGRLPDAAQRRRMEAFWDGKA
jgi:aryl-alcohol dehydrogenase-like predicted oxidoreductase